MKDTLTPDEAAFYMRQTVLPKWGLDGQERLKAARVLVVGAGGLGAPVLQYLAAAGVGTIGIADGDFVELSNLHRQVIHGVADIDHPKTASAARRLAQSNPHVRIVEHAFPITARNASDVVGGYDVVADCTDNFASRDALNTACLRQRKTLVSGAAQMLDGTVTTFAAFRGGRNPCYRCLYPAALGPALTPSCSEIGVAGPVLAVVGGIQAMEVIKEIIGCGDTLSGRILIYDGLGGTVNEIALERRPDCPACTQASASAQPPVTGG